MTPRNPWRRRIRDELIPILWLLATAALIGVALGQCIAHAEPAPTLTAGEVFAIDHAVDVCVALDAHPTVPGVLGVLTALTDYGLSATESGVALASSVVAVCPIHAPLLRQFVTKYGHEKRWTA